MNVLISAVLPIALVAIAGMGLGRCFNLDVQTLARVNIYAMLPALVLISLTNLTLESRSAIAMIAAYVLTTGVLYLISLGLGRGLNFSSDSQKSLIATTLFANVGNMGLPFILFALGDAGLERGVVYLVISSLMIASVFPIVLRGAGIKAGVIYSLRFPVFWAAVVGVALQVSRWDMPQAIARGASLLGEGVIPLALLTLGIQLSRSRFAIGPYELLGAGLRLVVSPILAYGIGRILGLGGLDLQVLVLQAAMPVAISSLIWVTELGGDAERVSRTIVLSTFLSFMTLPGVLWLISHSVQLF